MKHVLLDTVGVLALWDETDQWHEPASAAFAKLQQARAVLMTTSFILLECGNAAARRRFRGEVDNLRVRLEARDLVIVPTDEDWQSAWSAYRRGEAVEAGIVDHVSFVAMRRLGLNAAFTNDKHFRAAGFETLF